MWVNQPLKDNNITAKLFPKPFRKIILDVILFVIDYKFKLTILIKISLRHVSEVSVRQFTIVVVIVTVPTNLECECSADKLGFSETNIFTISDVCSSSSLQSEAVGQPGA